MIDVVTVGNALIDTFLALHNASAYAQVNSTVHTVSFHLGEKIPLDSCEFLLGGNACNVAVGMSRGGFSSALVAEIGTDAFSEMITTGLLREGVDPSHILKTEGSSSFAVGLNVEEDRILFVEHRHREHAFSFADIDAAWIYLTSLGHDWKAAYAAAIEFVKEKHVKLAFNPGTWQLEEGRTALAPALALTEVLFLNKEEAIKLLSVDSSVPIAKLLRMLADKGPKTVVITDGDRGSFALSERKQYHAKIAKAQLVERTGAGDAYSSGFLTGQLLGEDVPTSMRYGAAQAAGVVESVGAQPGLLSQAELKKRAEKVEINEQ